MKKRIFTIGHSTRTFDEFVAILDQYEITKLVDVRTIPKSRHNPQFNKENLQQKLRRRYIHLPGLGGLRHTSKDSPNTGWKNASFRGYADYMQTEAFEKNLEKLLDYAGKKQVAIMCAEAVPFRCHRSLIGDALLIRGYEVVDIYSLTNSKPHKLTGFAKVEGKEITYPPVGANQ
ncbi:MAG: DNA repair protein [Planctomycetes bacterium GWF2_41_51]|nr:MAG: DNA repair protein [Planctomycetes bacterium GWF2_41_51]HBG28821.1 DNA repair protein [Phycisphaerales bacterium]